MCVAKILLQLQGMDGQEEARKDAGLDRIIGKAPIGNWASVATFFES